MEEKHMKKTIITIIAQITEILLFVIESKITVFSQRNPKYNYYKRIYYKNNILAGYLTYKNEY